MCTEPYCSPHRRLGPIIRPQTGSPFALEGVWGCAGQSASTSIKRAVGSERQGQGPVAVWPAISRVDSWEETGEEEERCFSPPQRETAQPPFFWAMDSNKSRQRARWLLLVWGG